MKEHARVQSTKPLTSDEPGIVTVGDIMFIETNKSNKKPLLLHVDVFSRFTTGIPLKNRTEEVCTAAILDIKAEYQYFGHDVKQLVFDREPGIAPIESALKEKGIDLTLKAVGQKVGLAEVSIRSVREKARATKAGVRAKYNYKPLNAWNVDLCLDSISTLNQIPNSGKSITPYEMMTGKAVDYIHNFGVEWGEPIVVKKPKDIIRFRSNWSMGGSSAKNDEGYRCAEGVLSTVQKICIPYALYESYHSRVGTRRAK
jgi:hypothetical protein